MGQVESTIRPRVTTRCVAILAILATFSYVRVVDSRSFLSLYSGTECFDNNSVANHGDGLSGTLSVKESIGVDCIFTAGHPLKVREVVIGRDTIDMIDLFIIKRIWYECLGNKSINTALVFSSDGNYCVFPAPSCGKNPSLGQSLPPSSARNHMVEASYSSVIGNFIITKPINTFPCLHSYSPVVNDVYNMGTQLSQQQNVTNVIGGQ